MKEAEEEEEEKASGKDKAVGKASKQAGNRADEKGKHRKQ